MSNLKVGFGRVDITPPMGLPLAGYFHERYATGSLDALMASCMAFSDGEKTAVVFTVDNIGIRSGHAEDLRRTVAERTGLPFEAVYYACTHTHTGPRVPGAPYTKTINDPAYNSILYRKMADAAQEAIADLSEAEVYTARGEVKGISFIRRYKMKDGSTKTNPGRGNPEIDHAIGTPDEQLQMVKITREGKDDIVILNFQCHPDVIGGHKYSSDWPGWVRRSFEGAVPGTKCLFFNGAEGDTNHINTSPDAKTGGGYKHSRHMGLSITGEAMKLYTYAEKQEDDGKVDFIQHCIEVPSNRGKPEDIPMAEKIIAAHEAGRKEEIPFTGMGYTTAIARAYRLKRLENGPDSFTLNLTAVRFGNIVFSGIPNEPFTEIGRSIKKASPFDMTLVTCCSNGHQGYLPMQSAYDEGGYEANTSSFGPGVAESVIDGSLTMLDKLYNNK